tara:strand:+ start:2191 stop:2580 length:390 start_codon:yes stop_codon:yes gene_type:complete
MIEIFITGFSGIVFAFIWAGVQQYTVTREKCKDVGTSVDAMRIKSVENLVHLISNEHDDADQLVERMEKILYSFPPDENIMRRLSHMQQKVEGKGNSEEYSVMCMYMISMHILMEGNYRKPIVRVRSYP